MKHKYVITGAQPFDGEWELDFQALNGHEFRLIKKISGVRANEIDEAIAAGDYDVHIACAICALKRAGHAYVDEAEDVLLDAPGGSIVFRLSENGSEPDPPQTQPE